MFTPSFRLIHDPTTALADVYWITHAGGGTNTLVNRLRSLNGQLAARVYSPGMPAREELADVQFDGDLEEIAAALGRQIAIERQQEGLDRPFVLVGHSFGSVLAYRIAWELVARQLNPHRLVVLSFPAPGHTPHQKPLHTLSDEQLISEVDRLFGGIPETLRNEPGVLPFFLSGLRFDLGILERFKHRPSDPLPVPIIAICGTEDQAVDLSQMHRWCELTSKTFRLRSMPGNHFFPLARMPEILRIALWDVLPG
jgi:surfactin synthase thioesterase subunit